MHDHDTTATASPTTPAQASSNLFDVCQHCDERAEGGINHPRCAQLASIEFAKRQIAEAERILLLDDSADVSRILARAIDDLTEYFALDDVPVAA